MIMFSIYDGRNKNKMFDLKTTGVMPVNDMHENGGERKNYNFKWNYDMKTVETQRLPSN